MPYGKGGYTKSNVKRKERSSKNDKPFKEIVRSKQMMKKKMK